MAPNKVASGEKLFETQFQIIQQNGPSNLDSSKALRRTDCFSKMILSLCKQMGKRNHLQVGPTNVSIKKEILWAKLINKKDNPQINHPKWIKEQKFWKIQTELIKHTYTTALSFQSGPFQYNIDKNG